MNAQDWVDRLANIPNRITRAVAGQSDAALREPTRDIDIGWSAAEIFAHVRASDDIMAYRLYAVLVRDDPPLPGFDEHHWAEVAGYADADFQASLQTFASRRAELIHTLRRVVDDDWQRAGMHEIRGRETLLDALIYQVEHEEEHSGELEMLFSGPDS
ncbi:MAG: DinB family protein [Anaerolineae bacterium]